MGAVQAELERGTPPRLIIRKIDLEPYRKYQRFSERNIEILTRRIASLYITGR
jgi:hypothetical protein